LLEGTKRFNQLQRELGGITHRTLTKQLRELEDWGLVHRTDYQEIPPRVEYRLSTLGISLEPVLLAMHTWGERYGQTALQKKGTHNENSGHLRQS